jgi:hypothetical protein
MKTLMSYNLRRKPDIVGTADILRVDDGEP